MAAIVSMVPLILLATPPALVLPVASLLLLLAGFGLAAAGHWTGHPIEHDRLGARDVAGALMLLGFAAALMSDAEQVLAQLDQWQHAGAVAWQPM